MKVKDTKYNVGDVLQLAHSVHDVAQNSLCHVQEVRTITCAGGQQNYYACRVHSSNGAITTGMVQLNEIELMPMKKNDI
jgi:hypothetical protein